MTRFIKVHEQGSTLSTELLGGTTTFVTMAYIMVVNPAILAFAGIPIGPGTVATILTAAATISLVSACGVNPTMLGAAKTGNGIGAVNG
jgi:AGZA family xanthine/uracil permease-like MFS transporter